MITFYEYYQITSRYVIFFGHLMFFFLFFFSFNRLFYLNLVSFFLSSISVVMICFNPNKIFLTRILVVLYPCVWYLEFQATDGFTLFRLGERRERGWRPCRLSTLVILKALKQWTSTWCAKHPNLFTLVKITCQLRRHNTSKRPHKIPKVLHLWSAILDFTIFFSKKVRTAPKLTKKYIRQRCKATKEGQNLE